MCTLKEFGELEIGTPFFTKAGELYIKLGEKPESCSGIAQKAPFTERDVVVMNLNQVIPIDPRQMWNVLLRLPPQSFSHKIPVEEQEFSLAEAG